jgi:hypothetical protein
MRISVDETDSGWRTFEANGGRGARWRVMLDGVEVRNCITADEELGEVLTLVEDPEKTNALMIVDGRTVRRWRRGKVEITKL